MLLLQPYMVAVAVTTCRQLHEHLDVVMPEAVHIANTS